MPAASRWVVLFVLCVPCLGVSQTVTIAAPNATAVEAGVYPGTFRVARTGDLAQPLVVSLSYGGSAVVGMDCESLPPSVVIGAGQATANLTINPINNATVETVAKVVVATIAPSPAYTVGTPASASISIVDDDTTANSAPFLYKLVAQGANGMTAFWTDNIKTATKYRLQYRLEGATSWTTIDNIPAGTTQWSVGGLTSGVAYEFRVTAFEGTTSSQVASPARAVTIGSGVPPPAFTTFEQWRDAKQLSGTRRASMGRTSDDPDGDGKPNLLEYVLGSDPLTPDALGLSVGPSPGGGLLLQWPHNLEILDASVQLEEVAALSNPWQPSPLPLTTSNGTRTVTDLRTSPSRFYRLRVSPIPTADPSPVVTCWGDSLTGNPGTYVDKLKTIFPNRTFQNCGIGGDTAFQIGDRLRGLTLTSPFPAFSASTPAGTPVRIVASRTTHARIMNPSLRGNWPVWSGTIANVSKVEFFNAGRKIGETSAPLMATVTSNRTSDASRLISPGHPFADGDVVHFPAGPLPSPLVVGKPYYVRDANGGGFALCESDTLYSITANSTSPSSRFTSAGHPFSNGTSVSFRRGAAPPTFYSERVYYVRDADSGGFSLAETPSGPALSTIYSSTGNVLGPPGPPLSLSANFAAPSPILGPFVLNWSHPGGVLDLSIRTTTDRDANTFIFWIGRNNSARPHETYAELHAAIDHIKSLNARFLIVSVTNGAGESAGSPYYFGVINLNSLLRLEFPNEFVDIRSLLIRSASSDAGDQADRAADIPPRSLRSDSVHFNDAGQQIIADALAAELTKRGW